MPTYRSINIALHSQFGIETLPEYYPPAQAHYASLGINRTAPKLVDDDTATCSVYIPVLPGSIFWIGYSVSPPVPDGHYFLFKLYVNGAHIVSWSTGKEDKWKGKTMFGLYERAEDEDGKKRVEKRMLCFGPTKDVTDAFDDKSCMVIKVHRAHGRKRMGRDLEEYKGTQHAKNAKGINLVNAGRTSSEQPKRFYQFALTDPIDQPFAMFKYFYRTWEQLRALGLLEEDVGEIENLSVIEPDDGSRQEKSKGNRRSANEDEDVFHESKDGAADSDVHGSRPRSQRASTGPRPQSLVETRKPSRSELSQANVSEDAQTYVPRGAPGAELSSSDDEDDWQPQQRASQLLRLSVPPSIKLVPSESSSRYLPTIPEKTASSSSMARRPHPAYPVEQWRVRTPSPVRSVREGISTPPLERQREGGGSSSSLISALSSTWRRRRTASTERYGGDFAKGAGDARSASR